MDEAKTIPQPRVRTMICYTDQRTLLRIEGTEALDFLNRMSTNELSNLTAGETLTTVFTNEKGKIVELADIHRRADDILVIGARGDGSTLAQWLERFIIMEDIRIQNLSAKFLSIDSLHPESALTPPDSDQTLLSYCPALWSGRLRRTLVEAGAQDQLTTMPRAPGKSAPQSTTRSIDSPTEPGNLDFQLQRLRLGLPEEGKELTADYNPLEARLDRFISFTKGCYIGQEVISRIDSYKKLQRHLFKLTIAVPDGSHSHLPSFIQNENRSVGVITSYAFDAKTCSYAALGYIELKYETASLTINCNCNLGHAFTVISQ
jgi:folate-binding protein YgfZ